MRDVITTAASPRPIGPFSQAIRANGFLFLSGQVAVDPETQKLTGGDVGAQTDRILRNIQAVLRAAGAELENVVRSGVYLRRMDDFAAMNAMYAKYFPDRPPARTTVEVSRLPLDALIEIDVVAVMP